MRQQHEVDVTEVEVERFAILALGFTPALKQPAIDQKASPLVIDTQAGARNLARRPQKSEPHLAPPRVFTPDSAIRRAFDRDQSQQTTTRRYN